MPNDGFSSPQMTSQTSSAPEPITPHRPRTSPVSYTHLDVYKRQDDILEINTVVEPNEENHRAYAAVKERFEVCYKALLPVYEYMSQK